MQAQPFPAIVTVYKSRGELSLIGQPTIQCVFLAYFDPKKYNFKQKIYFFYQLFSSDARIAGPKPA